MNNVTNLNEYKKHKEIHSVVQNAIVDGRLAVRRLNDLGSRMLSENDFEGAKLAFCEALDILPNSESHFQLGVVYERLNSLDDAREHFLAYQCMIGA